MRWSWRRHKQPDPVASAAAKKSAAKLEAIQQRQTAVDRVTEGLADLAGRDRFAEAVEIALTRRRQR